VQTGECSEIKSSNFLLRLFLSRSLLMTFFDKR
jgi:hypothetical protein